jgi:hypothetical protein
VLVWKFDSFAQHTLLAGGLEEFNHLGVRFVSLKHQIDTDSPTGRWCSPSSSQWLDWVIAPATRHDGPVTGE